MLPSLLPQEPQIILSVALCSWVLLPGGRSAYRGNSQEFYGAELHSCSHVEKEEHKNPFHNACSSFSIISNC